MPEQIYPKPDKYSDPHLERPFILDCHLAYDGGGGSWKRGYRTRRGALFSAWWNYHVSSYGGSITLIHNGVDTQVKV